MREVEHNNGTAIFMLSSNFKTALHGDKLKPGWHDVIQTENTHIGKPFARRAVVAFVEAHGVEALPRSETHRWA